MPVFFRPNAEWTTAFPTRKALGAMSAGEASLAAEAVFGRLGAAIGNFRDVVKYGQGSLITEVKLVRKKLQPPIVRLRLQINPRQLKRLARIDPEFKKLPPQVSYE